MTAPEPDPEPSPPPPPPPPPPAPPAARPVGFWFPLAVLVALVIAALVLLGLAQAWLLAVGAVAVVLGLLLSVRAIHPTTIVTVLGVVGTLVGIVTGIMSAR